MDKHPKVVVFVGGRPVVMDCDCGGCERRSPVYAGALVFGVALVAYAIIAWAVF